ncbi:MAG: hypothetical protein RIT45_3142 [Pseudomonadota bacterium]
MAPRGASRATLAERIAHAQAGRVRRGFLAQTEPSKASGVEVFDNLTLAFRVERPDGRWIASCVDDLTLQHDLDRSGTNPNCRQLGAWPAALRQCVETPGFVELDWPQARAALAGVGLSKFCDLNLLGLASQHPSKPTVEVRVLPGAIETESIVMGAALFEAVLRRSLAPEPVPAEAARAVRARTSRALLESLPLDADVRAYWLARI